MANAKASRTNRRRDADRKFRWLKQIAADHELPPSAMLVAFEIMQGFNAKFGGAAWKSIETLAEETGLSEPSIVRITRQLVQRGHLRIEPGKAGSGHSNRYFMALKTSTSGGFKTSASGGFRPARKTSTGESKTSTSGGDSLKTPLTEEARASSVGEREERSRALAVIPGALAPDGGAPKEEFDRLWALWSPHRNFPDTDEDEAAAWKAYVAIVPPEASPNEIYSRAEAHIAGVKANGLKVGDLWKWLSRDNWRKEPPPPPTPKRKSREPTAGEVLLRKYGDRS